VRIALIDSGVAAGHPHLAGAELTGFGLDGDAPPFARTGAFADRTGHGTAAAAVLHWRAPGHPLLAIRVLDEDLRCTSALLAHAIRLAADEGAQVINLSLGSTRDEARDELAAAVDHAAGRGALCVAAAHPRGRALWPADLPTVISAKADRGCPAADLYSVPGQPRFIAHGFPRPIEGRRPTDNFSGTSFAAAHVAAAVARLQPSSFDEAVAGLRAQAVGDWQAV
jgi:subtilisin family serine protease